MDLGNLLEAVRPWLSTSALVGLFAFSVKLFLDNRKMTLDSDGGIRDHYAKELSSLRAQILDSQRHADERLSNAEKRYTQAMDEADRRHNLCEKECDRLRTKVYGLERQIEQIHLASLKIFELRDDLSDEVKQFLRALDQRNYVPEGNGHDSNHP